MNLHNDNIRFYSVKEVCEAVGLGKSRFYQLLGTTFPWPAYLIASRRPVFTEEQFQQCCEARRTNQGIDGKPVMFYSRRRFVRPRKPARKKPSQMSAKSGRHTQTIEALGQLGLTNISEKDITTALKRLSLTDTDSNKGEMIARLFRFFKARKHQNSGDNVER